MKNRTKKIIAGACIGIASLGVLSGCSASDASYRVTVINDTAYGCICPDLRDVTDGTSSVMVKKGDSYTFTITPNSGYYIENLIIDGVKEEPKETYTFTNIKKSHSIGAVYAKNAVKDVNHISGLKIIGMKFKASTYGVSRPNDYCINTLEFYHIKSIMQGFEDHVSVGKLENISVDFAQSDNVQEHWALNTIPLEIPNEIEIRGDRVSLKMSITILSDFTTGSEPAYINFNRADLEHVDNAYHDNIYTVSHSSAFGYTGKVFAFKDLVLIMEATYSSEPTI